MEGRTPGPNRPAGGLSARTAPALARRLPFSPGCVLRLGLLDFKAVIFPSHKRHSRFAWRTIGRTKGLEMARWECINTSEIGRSLGEAHTTYPK